VRDVSLYLPERGSRLSNSHFDCEPLFVGLLMTKDEKEVHFNKKRVDETWKEVVSKEKADVPEAAEQPLVSFSTFITSLGIQAFIRMGELKSPDGEKVEVDLAAAQETIDLLLMLKEKTKGNLASEEESLLSSLIADLQLKFVQHKMS